MKLLRGSRRGKRVKVEAPQAPVASLTAPVYLHGDALELWDQLAGELVKLGRLTVVDVPKFAAFCAAFGTWREYERECKNVGPQAAVTMGYRNAADRAVDRMDRLGGRFGMDPVSVGSVKAQPPKAGDAAHELRERFFGIAGKRA